jgi:uroporphyrinogen decarboxylase
MNSYERAKVTLEGGIPDRVPSFELMIDPAVITKIIGYDSYMDLCEYLDIDILVTPTPSKLYRETLIDEKKRIYKNEWGIVRRYSDEVVSIPMEGPIIEPEDILSYKPPDPLDEYRFEPIKALVKRFKGKKLVGMHLHDSLNYTYYLRGMENLFMDLILDPELVHSLVDISIEHNMKMAEKAIDLGADFIIFGDDYGTKLNTMMSPEHFNEFFLPGLRKIVQAVKAKGAYALKHCCGNINAILDDMLDTGFDGIHPLDANAGMNMKAVKDTHKNLTIIGGIDCAAPLTSFTEEEMTEEVKRILKLNAPGGRYIIASSNSVHSKTRPENFIAMQKAVQKYGLYSRSGELLF